MDKFGIFKLLNSFCDYYDKNVKNKNGDSSQETPDLGKADLNKNSVCNDCKNRNNLSATPVPLQDKMLDTMRRHEEIIKRVNAEKPK